MSNLNIYLETADTETTKTLLFQWKTAVEKQMIICPCGQPRAIEMAYRCLYCGIWFCFNCAELHFGETFEERLAKRQQDCCTKN